MDSRSDLLDVFRFFPGISATSDVHATDGGGVVLEMAFDDTAHGKTARLAVQYIADRVGAERDGDRTWRCDATQTTPFIRYLSYASLRRMGKARPEAELAATPLPTLLSHALHGFEREYDELAANAESKPHLGVWANVLRVIPCDGLDLRELGPSAILAKRAVRVVVRDLEAQGWLEVEKVARGLKMLRLTTAGRAAEEAGRRLAADVERRWRKRFRAATIDSLRDALGTIADAIDVELPCYLTGYGPGDGAITGGPYLPEEPGPPRIPARGEEFPVVPRHSSAAELPLFALLSIVLAQFAIDYERERLGDLRSASTLLQDIADGGTPLERVRHQRLSGSGRSTPERHLWVVVDRGKRGDMPLVYPSPKARIARDSYRHLVVEIERNWNTQHGAATMAALRTGLAALDAKVGAGWPPFPDTMLWFERLHDRNP